MFFYAGTRAHERRTSWNPRTTEADSLNAYRNVRLRAKVDVEHRPVASTAHASPSSTLPPRYSSPSFSLRFIALSSSLAALTLTLACSSSPQDGGSGKPFPSRRTAFASEGRTLAYVANQSSDTISVLDLDTMSVLGTVPVGADPVEIDGPRGMALDRERGFLYVLFTYPESVPSAHAASVGVKSRLGLVQQLALDDLAPLGEIHVDARAFELALSPERDLIAASHFDQDLGLNDALEARRANIALIGPPEEIAAGTAGVLSAAKACAVPAQLTFAKDRSRVYVACTGEDSLAVIDTSTGSVLSRVPAGDSSVNKPYAILASADGARIFLGNQLTGQVVAFPAADSPAPLFSSPELMGGPYGLGRLGADAIAVALQNANGAALLDVNTGMLLAQVTFTEEQCLNPTAVQASAAGRLYLVCEGDHYTPGSVVELDAATLAIKGSVKVGLYPDRLLVLDP